MNRRTGTWPALRLAPLFIPFGLIFLGGLILAAAQSLGWLTPTPSPGGPGAAYIRLASDPWFWSSLGFTLYVALVSALLSVVGGTLVAYAAWRLPRRLLGLALVYKIPLVLPHIAVAFVVLIVWTQSGFMASVAWQLGWIDRPADFPAVLFSGFGLGLIMAYAYKGGAFVVLLVWAALRRLDPRQIEAAGMLGAGRVMILRSVVLPHLRPVLHTTFIILFLYAFGAFDIPFLLSESYPGMLSIMAFDLFFRRDLSHRPEAMAVLTIMFVFAVAFIYLYVRMVAHLESGARKL